MKRLWALFATLVWFGGTKKKDTSEVRQDSHEPIVIADPDLPDELKRIIGDQFKGSPPKVIIANIGEDGHYYDENGKRL